MATTEDGRECLDEGGHKGPCEGEVLYHLSIAGTGTMIPRCDKHYAMILEVDQEIREKYPVNAPSDFDPMDAGEVWGEDDY